jgi:hypothetical protein
MRLQDFCGPSKGHPTRTEGLICVHSVLVCGKKDLPFSDHRGPPGSPASALLACWVGGPPTFAGVPPYFFAVLLQTQLLTPFRPLGHAGISTGSRRILLGSPRVFHRVTQGFSWVTQAPSPQKHEKRNGEISPLRCSFARVAGISAWSQGKKRAERAKSAQHSEALTS